MLFIILIILVPFCLSMYCMNKAFKKLDEQEKKTNDSSGNK